MRHELHKHCRQFTDLSSPRKLVFTSRLGLHASGHIVDCRVRFVAAIRMSCLHAMCRVLDVDVCLAYQQKWKHLLKVTKQALPYSCKHFRGADYSPLPAFAVFSSC